MPVAGGFQQNVAQSGTGPDKRVVGDANLLGNCVGGLEADAVDVLREGIRVVLDGFNGGLAVGLIDADGAAGAHAIGMQEHHDGANDLLLGPGIFDPLPALGADPVNLL